MIVELRQYPLRPGTVDGFVELFDTHFVESQEEVGIQVLGTFRDVDDPDRFVWLRAFPDMASRRAALEAFYLAPAPAWRDHRTAANAAIADSDDVLLLTPEPGWSLPAAPIGTPDVAITVWPGRLDLGVPALVTADEVNDFPA
ncbi:MAG TPA: NIPSNAP family protein, partial [Iamia sp.]|nr:NIPSNAP family protein [Iamia sp.]